MQSLSVSDSFTVTVVQNRRPVDVGTSDAEIPNMGEGGSSVAVAVESTIDLDSR